MKKNKEGKDVGVEIELGWVFFRFGAKNIAFLRGENTEGNIKAREETIAKRLVTYFQFVAGL